VDEAQICYLSSLKVILYVLPTGSINPCLAAQEETTSTKWRLPKGDKTTLYRARPQCRSIGRRLTFLRRINVEFSSWSRALPGHPSGYNQITMYLHDEEKMTFMIEGANYYYTIMPFSLNNAGATYQRLMDKVFIGRINNIMEVCEDDMVVKCVIITSHLEHYRFL